MSVLSDETSTYLAFDLGASTGRAILGWITDGRIETVDVHRFQTPMIESGGHLYWDLDRLWSEMQEGFELARAASGRLRSLSVDSWGVDYVPLDEEGRPVRAPYVYRDSRTNGLFETAFSRVGRDEIYAATGIQFMEINTLYQVLSDVLSEPDLQARTHTRLLMADYFNHRFCGSGATEVSLASTTQLMHAGSREWATSLISNLGLPATGWSPIVASGTILGPAFGTPDVTVVAGCSHDTACAVAAVPAPSFARDWAYISCGTWSLLGVELDRPLLTASARDAGFTNEAGLDGTIRFLKNMTGLWILQECERTWAEGGDAVSYEELLSEAKSARAPDALLDVSDPAFSRRCDMPAAIRTFCASRNWTVPERRGELVRLVLESLAEGHRITLRELEAVLGRTIETLYLVGGGSQNGLLCQLTADRCGIPVVAGPAEATALGNLLIQARTMGALRSGIRDVVRASVALQTYEPQEV